MLLFGKYKLEQLVSALQGHFSMSITRSESAALQYNIVADYYNLRFRYTPASSNYIHVYLLERKGNEIVETLITRLLTL